MMVKNEEKTIKQTLQPFVDAGMTSFFVLDTGSTDNTVAIVKDFFMTHNCNNSCIKEESFIDFATSRNHALLYAKEHFSQATFILFLDAEWYLNDVQGLVNFCKRCLVCQDVYSCYLIKIVHGPLVFYTPRLIRCNINVEFKGIVHETITSQVRVKVPEEIYFTYEPSLEGGAKSYARYYKDRELLYEEHKKNPFDMRVLLYLALTCEFLGNMQEAYDLYKKRVMYINNEEDDFVAYYHLGQIVEKLSVIDKDYSWQEALLYYLQAYLLRPTRIEPLLRIAEHYIAHNKKDVAIFFALHAIAKPYPKNDLLFIKTDDYESIRYELLRSCMGIHH